MNAAAEIAASTDRKPVRADTRLSDALDREHGHAFMTGMTAIVRALLLQARRDRQAGLRTAGFVTGYRGSPLGMIDQALLRSQRELERHDIRFLPGLNEDLAATSVWGTQQVGLYEKANVDGVFGIWYGKGPGVDRSMDALKHANLAGTARHGGVLVLAGDDHMCKSSTAAFQSEPVLIAAGIPILNPASIEEVIPFALAGIAMSRFSGCWVALKCLTDVMDSSASLSLDALDIAMTEPAEFDLPPGGLNIRRVDSPLEQERRLLQYKLAAARAFVQANHLDRVTHDSASKRIGIVTTGKSWLDVLAALALLDIDEQRRAQLGIAIYKVAMPWPLETGSLIEFARECTELLFIEEKRGIVEEQAVAALYRLPAASRPAITGKRDGNGAPFLPEHGELDAKLIARVILERLAAHGSSVPQPAALLSVPAAAAMPAIEVRAPWFCSGCPHNTSTRVPEGSVAGAGIGCHGLAALNDAGTTLPALVHMGGEGANWIGRAPFVDRKHIFQNLGDGTYNHSGLLAVRATVAAGVNITYKILFNDAVAMTGGQAHEGRLTPAMIARQLLAENVKRVVVVSDDPGKYAAGSFPRECDLFGRDDLDRVQRELREIEGVTALIYDQECATNKRRRRKRGLASQPDFQVFINSLVCEGCGDCGQVSNCVAIQPVKTPLGVKRTIDLAQCNLDVSCVKGFCPSFVTVKRPTRRADERPAATLPPEVPAPRPIEAQGEYTILLTGIGGTGVVTTAALLGMAAHLDGWRCRVMDQTGMAQKNGAVVSHVMLAPPGTGSLSGRVAASRLDLLLGCDLVTAAATSTLSLIGQGRTRAIVNTNVAPTGAFTRNSDARPEADKLLARLIERTGAGAVESVEASHFAATMLGDTALMNVLLLGHAWQRGLIPLSLAALERAIELNDVAVARNLAAFAWGRAIAHQGQSLPQLAQADGGATESAEQELARRCDFLTEYQNRLLAERYKSFVDWIAAEEQRRLPGSSAIAAAVAQSLFKLMAYKDEYEVARLLTDPAQLRRLRMAAPSGSLRFHLAPPLFARTDPRTGHPHKIEFGEWLLPVLRALRGFKFLRGTWLDPFGHTRERRSERADITGYQDVMKATIGQLSADTKDIVLALARVPLSIRGFGHVKERAREQAIAAQAALLEQLRSSAPASQTKS